MVIDKKLGFALCGSFCTLEPTLQMMAGLAAAGWEIQPIMSPATYETDTRFGTAEHWRDRVEALCGRPIWHSVAQVEPVGPRRLLDILLVAPHRQHAGQACLRHHRYAGDDGGKGAPAQ